MRLFVPLMMAGILLMGAFASEYYKSLFGEFGRDSSVEENAAHGPFDAELGYKKPQAMPQADLLKARHSFTNRSTHIHNRNGEPMRSTTDYFDAPSKGRKRRAYKNPYTN